MEFIKEWGYVLYVTIAVIVYAIFAWGSVKNKAWQGILNAKRLAKEKVLSSGKEQEDFAVTYFYPLIPAGFKAFVSEQAFRSIVRFIYSKAVDLMDDGTFNNSTEKETKK